MDQNYISLLYGNLWRMQNRDGIYIRCGISTCMLNSQHEFSSSCSSALTGSIYRNSALKDRPAGVNNLYIVRFSLSVFHLNTNEPFSTVRFQRTKGVKRNRGICTCHSQPVGRATMAAEWSGFIYVYIEQKVFFISVESFSLNWDLHWTLISLLFSVSITSFHYTLDHHILKQFSYISIIINFVYYITTLDINVTAVLSYLYYIFTPSNICDMSNTVSCR